MLWPHTGYVWIAKRPCGRVSALAHDTPGNERLTQKMVQRWLDRGDSVSRIPLSEKLSPSICWPGEPCACRDAVPRQPQQAPLIEGDIL